MTEHRALGENRCHAPVMHMVHDGKKVQTWTCACEKGHGGPHESHLDNCITLGGGAYLELAEDAQ